MRIITALVVGFLTFLLPWPYTLFPPLMLIAIYLDLRYQRQREEA